MIPACVVVSFDDRARLVLHVYVVGQGGSVSHLQARLEVGDGISIGCNHGHRV